MLKQIRKKKADPARVKINTATVKRKKRSHKIRDEGTGHKGKRSATIMKKGYKDY